MKKMARVKNTAILLLLCCVLTACGWRSPAPDYYVLAPEATVAPLAAGGPSVLLRKLALPAYLDRENLVLRQGQDLHLVLAERKLWAEGLNRALPRLLEESMRPVLQQQGLDMAWEDGASQPALLVDVTVLRFDGSPGHEVELVARWRVLDQDESLLIQGGFGKKAGGGNDYAEMVQALRQLGVELGQELAGAALTAQAGRARLPGK